MCPDSDTVIFSEHCETEFHLMMGKCVAFSVILAPDAIVCNFFLYKFERHVCTSRLLGICISFAEESNALVEIKEEVGQSIN